MESLNGYVIYSKQSKDTPIGVVSDGYECKADTFYIPDQLKNFLIQVEDKRFLNHNGIDIKAISRAFFENIKAGKIVQGGSTITQQLARNLMRNNNKTILRKLKETVFAFQLENKFSKDEIVNLYFDNIYFGKNIRGIRTAGLYYFGKELESLNQAEILYLLTILRGPNYYIKRVHESRRRYLHINNFLYQNGLISLKKKEKNTALNVIPRQHILHNFKNASIPYIIKYKNDSTKKIFSSIDVTIQSFIRECLQDSKYPVSIIAIRNKEVIGFASSYGTDYPFISRSNVGSTLKPFLYCHLREKGVSNFETFDAMKNNLEWQVREASFYKPYLTLEEALYHSNNNAFINAVYEYGMDESIDFLSRLFTKNKNDFFPSSILGASRSGISLYELAMSYSVFFDRNKLSDSKIECLAILNKIFRNKLNLNIDNSFLKTGTTNENKERYAILGNPEITFAILRNENLINDDTKEGGLMNYISRNFSFLFKKQTNYKWI